MLQAQREYDELVRQKAWRPLPVVLGADFQHKLQDAYTKLAQYQTEVFQIPLSSSSSTSSASSPAVIRMDIQKNASTLHYLLTAPMQTNIIRKEIESLELRNITLQEDLQAVECSLCSFFSSEKEKMIHNDFHVQKRLFLFYKRNFDATKEQFIQQILHDKSVRKTGEEICREAIAKTEKMIKKHEEKMNQLSPESQMMLKTSVSLDKSVSLNKFPPDIDSEQI